MSPKRIVDIQEIRSNPQEVRQLFLRVGRIEEQETWRMTFLQVACTHWEIDPEWRSAHFYVGSVLSLTVGNIHLVQDVTDEPKDEYGQVLKGHLVEGF